MPDTIEAARESQNGTVTEKREVAPSRKKEKPPRSNTGLLVLTLIFSLIGAISGGGGLFLYWQSLQPATSPISEVEMEEDVLVEEIEGIDFLRYNDYHLPIYEELGLNDYDVEAFGELNGKITYPDAAIGIDVSQYQGDIDWEAVANDDVTFAIIRLGYRGYGTEGNILLDEKFHQNMEGAKAAGLDVGVYFFSQATSVWEAMEEASFVLENLKGYTLELPIVYDWEFIDYSSSARTNNALGRSITLYTLAFCEEMEASGYDAMVYFNQNLGYLYLELDELVDYPFWLASYRSIHNFHYHFDIWQYSDKGVVDGIDGYVDLNLMFTDLTA